MKRVAIVGMGSIGTAIAAQWRAAPPPGCRLVGVLARDHQQASLKGTLADDALAVGDIAALLESRPDVVIEAAGQSAVAQLGVSILRGGADLMVISTGALADLALRAALVEAANDAGRDILLPVGGIAGLDGLRAMVRSGPTRVTYTSIKPPLSWLGTPAEAAFDLRAMTKRTVIFSGNAADAALRYPRNANLAAAVALAGVGFGDTLVDLVADPTVEGLLGIIDAQGAVGSMRVEVLGRMSQTNNKTSAVVGISALEALFNDAARLRFV